MTERDDAGAQREHEARHGDDGDRDPLLVRPFIGAPSAQTWPSAADRPAHRPPSHRAAESPIARPGRPGSSAASLPATERPGRLRVVAVGAGAAAVLVLAAAGFAVTRSGGGGDDLAARQTLPPVSPPAATAAASDLSTGPSSSRTGPLTARRPEQRARGEPARTPTDRPSTGRPRTSPSGSGSGADSAAPAGRQAVVPAADLTGAIAGPGGQCLDLNGAVAADGNFIDVYECNGTNAQVWTASTDGTLRVLGKCAQSISRDNTIHIIGCDSRTSSQWRAGADSSLINVAVGRCLTDPSNGRTKGEAVRLSPCTGDANQRFTLPP